MRSKTLGLVFTGVLFGGTAALGQNANAGQQAGTMGQQNPYAMDQTGKAGQAKQLRGTVSSFSPNNEITVCTSDGKLHRFNLSPSGTTSVSPTVTRGNTVTVTESVEPNGQRVITITPSAAAGAGATGAAGTMGTSGQTGGGTGY